MSGLGSLRKRKRLTHLWYSSGSSVSRKRIPPGVLRVERCVSALYPGERCSCTLRGVMMYLPQPASCEMGAGASCPCRRVERAVPISRRMLPHGELDLH